MIQDLSEQARRERLEVLEATPASTGAVALELEAGESPNKADGRTMDYAESLDD